MALGWLFIVKRQQFMVIDGNKSAEFGVVFGVVAVIKGPHHGHAWVVIAPSDAIAGFVPADGQGLVLVSAKVVFEGSATDGFAQQLAFAQSFKQLIRTVLEIHRGCVKRFSKKPQFDLHTGR